MKGFLLTCFSTNMIWNLKLFVKVDSQNAFDETWLSIILDLWWTFCLFKISNGKAFLCPSMISYTPFHELLKKEIKFNVLDMVIHICNLRYESETKDFSLPEMWLPALKVFIVFFSFHNEMSCQLKINRKHFVLC